MQCSEPYQMQLCCGASLPLHQSRHRAQGRRTRRRPCAQQAIHTLVLLSPSSSWTYTGRYESCMSVAMEHSICPIANASSLRLHEGSLNTLNTSMILATTFSLGFPASPSGAGLLEGCATLARTSRLALPMSVLYLAAAGDGLLSAMALIGDT